MSVGAKWRLAGWVLLPVAAAVQGLLPAGPAERYARGLYPHIARAFSLADGWVPFSVAEVLLVLLAVAAVGLLIRALRSRQRLAHRAGATLLTGLSLAGYLLTLYTLSWGINYRRPPLSARLGIPTGGTAGDLAQAAAWLSASAGRLAPHGAPAQPTRLPYSRAELNALVDQAYARLGMPAVGFPGRLGSAKPVFLSGILSRLGLAGVFCPFTGEPNYNQMLPDAELVFSLAHEKAHQRGIAPENEANFAAFLALHASPDAYLRYCGDLNAAGYLLAPLRRTNAKGYDRAVALLEGRPLADFDAMRAFWRRYRGPAQRVATRVNDLYLKANRVAGGVQSYGAVTDLLVGYYRKHGDGATGHSP